MAAFRQVLVGKVLGGGGGGGYTPVNTEAADLFTREAAVGTSRDDAEKEAADDFIGALIAAGVWSKIECLHISKKAPSSAAALLDWSHVRSGTINGAMAWAKATGWTSAGADANFIGLNDPTTPLVAGLSHGNQWWGLGVPSKGSGNAGGYMMIGPNMLAQWTSSTLCKIGCGQSGPAGVTVPTLSRLYASRASSSSTVNWAADGGARTGVTSSPSSPSPRSIVLGRGGSGLYGTGTWEFFVHGLPLSLTEEQAFDAAIVAYLA